VKAVSSKVPVPPLLRQRHNAAFGLLHLSSFGPSSQFEFKTLGLRWNPLRAQTSY